MTISIPTTSKSQANYVLNFFAKNFGVKSQCGTAAYDSNMTLVRESDNSITISCGFTDNVDFIAAQLPKKWAKFLKENY